MADRVEARAMLVGRGNGTTPERIESLRRQAHELERQRPGIPTRVFSELVINKATARSPPKPNPRRKQRRLVTTPKAALAHPSQQGAFGLEESPVVIKG